jgi:Ni/Co efflux regulator RcnB
MKINLRKIILVIICLIPFAMSAQEAAAPAKDKAPASSRAQRKKAKQKWKENRILERDQAKAVKDHHKRIQTKKTNRRMREEKRRSERLRTNKKEFFIVRWYKYGFH